MAFIAPLYKKKKREMKVKLRERKTRKRKDEGREGKEEEGKGKEERKKGRKRGGGRGRESNILQAEAVLNDGKGLIVPVLKIECLPQHSGRREHSDLGTDTV